MTVATTAPLPRLRALPLVLRRTARADGTLAAPWCGGATTPFLFSRAAWGLRALADGVAAARGRPARLWLPDWFCNAATLAVRAGGHVLDFYPVGEDTRPDWTACEALGPPPDLFLLVHYFGWPAETAPARAFCAANGALLVEDAAHALIPGPGIGEAGDAALWSLYKHLPLPDGGLLGLRTDGNELAARLARAAAALGAAPPAAGRWIVRRALQCLLPGVASRLRAAPRAFDSDPAPTPLAPTPAMSVPARRLLAGLVSELEATAARRCANEAAVRTALDGASGLKPLFASTAGVVPYRAVFRGTDAAAARRWYDRLSARNAVESWPDLPPEVRAEPRRHQGALALRATVIALPVHADRTPEALAAAYGAAL